MKHLFYSLIVIVFLSCSSEVENQLITGNWKTVAWTKLATGKKMNNQMDFQFKADGRYKVDYGTELEEGKYWVRNEYLHTVEDGRSEKKVKLISVTADSMVFEMNRAGELENVVLIKE